MNDDSEAHNVGQILRLLHLAPITFRLGPPTSLPASFYRISNSIKLRRIQEAQQTAKFRVKCRLNKVIIVVTLEHLRTTLSDLTKWRENRVYDSVQCVLRLCEFKNNLFDSAQATSKLAQSSSIEL